MDNSNQNAKPISDLLTDRSLNRTLRLDTPSYKGLERETRDLKALFGENRLNIDNSSKKIMYTSDNTLSNLEDAQYLASEVFDCKKAFFMENGLTSGIIAMILTTVKPGEKIILPRNVHISAVNAMIINDIIPIYINPIIDNLTGITLNLSINDIEKTIQEHPDVKAILIDNPTPFGVCSDLNSIVKLCHTNKVRVLVNENYGANFYFGESMPVSGISAHADLCYVGMQSINNGGYLLVNNDISTDDVNVVINLIKSATINYVNIASIDLARKNMSKNGTQISKKMRDYASHARNKIKEITGFTVVSYTNDTSCTENIDFDMTKLSICATKLGLTGFELFILLRDKHQIICSSVDFRSVAIVLSEGNKVLELERLILALEQIKENYTKYSVDFEFNNDCPTNFINPRTALYCPKEHIDIEKSVSLVAGECIMFYPSLSPLIVIGETITSDVLETILYLRDKNCLVSTSENMDFQKIKVLKF